DGTPEVALATYHGTLYLLNHDGSVHEGWPVRLPAVPSCPHAEGVTRPDVCMDARNRVARGALASPVLADLDRDGRLEWIQAAFDGSVYAFHGDGTPLPRWPVEVHYPDGLEHGRIVTTPAVADFNRDGTPDLLVGSNERLGSGGQFGAFYLIDGRRPQPAFFPNWPVTLASAELSPIFAEGTTSSAIAA